MPKYIVYYEVSVEVEAPTQQSAEREVLGHIGWDEDYSPEVIETDVWSEKMEDDDE